ncbi:hypothetical protein Gasu2_40410 [Galdieria sulphuraria]|nr:hypothetical protein Gasu2_40410 [Galdieria sulphuraria]
MTSSQELEDGELQENSPLPFTLIEQQPTYNPLVDTATHKFAVPPYYLQRTNHIKDTNQEQPKRIRENQHGLPEESVGSAQQVGFVTEWNPRPVDLQETQERQYEKYVDSYQVIQVISSLIAQGFPVPSDWLQNPQIYQWLVEWIKQSTQKPFLNSLSTEQSQLSGDNSFNVVTTPPFNRSIQKNAKERNPPQRVSSPGTFIKTRKGKMRNFKSMPQKHNNSSKNMKYHRKQQRNEVHENINSSHEETTCKESNLRVQNDTKYSMIEQQKELNETSQEQKKNPLSVEQLRIQAKMSLKRKASIENKDIEKTACHQDDNIENERDKPSLKVKESTLSNSNHPENHSSSLVITVESSSSSSSSNNASTEQVQNKNNQKNALVSGTSQSKWSTLEELRRRVQELEQRKKQYLQRGISWTKDKRPKITDSNTQKQGNIADSLDDKSKASHYWQTFAPSQPQLSSLEAQGTEEKQSGSKGNHSSTMKRLSSPKHVSFDDSDTDETKAWIERLEREACKAWDEHDKSITEEIEARNKLIRIRTCEEAARESTKLLRELLKKSRLDIQQYESQSRSIERQIEQIEARRKLALAMAEKNQRKLERLRRLVAMESLISKVAF